MEKESLFERYLVFQLKILLLPIMVVIVCPLEILDRLSFWEAIKRLIRFYKF